MTLVDRIKALAQAIGADVKEALGIANEAKDKIDELDIGGRNLLAFKNIGAYGGGSVKTLSSSYYEIQDEKITVKREIKDLLGFKVDSVVGYSQLILSGYTSHNRPTVYYRFDNDTQKGAIHPGISNGYFELIINVPDGAEYLYIGVGQYPNVGDSEFTPFYFDRLKLEKGNKATDWTPAIEDIDKSLTVINSHASQAKAQAQLARAEASNAQDSADEAYDKAQSILDKGFGAVTKQDMGWEGDLNDNVESGNYCYDLADGYSDILNLPVQVSSKAYGISPLSGLLNVEVVKSPISGYCIKQTLTVIHQEGLSSIYSRASDSLTNLDTPTQSWSDWSVEFESDGLSGPAGGGSEGVFDSIKVGDFSPKIRHAVITETQYGRDYKPWLFCNDLRGNRILSSSVIVFIKERDQYGREIEVPVTVDGPESNEFYGPELTFDVIHCPRNFRGDIRENAIQVNLNEGASDRFSGARVQWFVTYEVL